MRALVLIIKNALDVTSRCSFIAQILLLSLVLVLLLGWDIEQNQQQMRASLEDSATEMAARVAKSVSPTVWDVFQRSDSRQYSENFASGVLDSELAAGFALSIHVYASFGSVLMAREKLPDGTVHSLNSLKESRTEHLVSGKIRYPVSSSGMTIGHIDVYYTDKIHARRAAHHNWRVVSLYLGIAVLLFSLLYLLRKASLAKLEAQTALENLEQVQEQLIHSEKMACLGNLVAGLAHEINTPLGIALTSSTSSLDLTKNVQEKLAANSLCRSELESYLESIREASEMAEKGLCRAADLVGNFKLISVDQNIEESREINLYEYLEEVMSTLSIELKKRECRWELKGDKKLTLRTVPGIIAQLITNLTNNALIHAFSEQDDKRITIHITKKHDTEAVISFIDNGCGMDKETLSHIYEPFYTTKRGRGGSGLGMNIVFNLITEKLKGGIQIESTPGEGTRVELSLPLS